MMERLIERETEICRNTERVNKNVRERQGERQRDRETERIN